METLEQRIKRFREERKLSQQQVADKVGVSRVAVTKWESGQTANLKLGNLLSLCSLFSVSVEELVRGNEGGLKLSDAIERGIENKRAWEEQAKKDNKAFNEYFDGANTKGSGNIIDITPTLISDSFVKFEKYPIAMSAGHGAVSQQYGQDEIEFIEVAEWWARSHVGSIDANRIKVVPCRGSSMSPTIPDGSLLFVDVNIKNHIGDGIYCIDLDHRLLVKRINLRQKERVFEVISDNKKGPDTETYPLSEQDRMCICGKVVAWLAVQKDE